MRYVTCNGRRLSSRACDSMTYIFSVSKVPSERLVMNLHLSKGPVTYCSKQVRGPASRTVTPARRKMIQNPHLYLRSIPKHRRLAQPADRACLLPPWTPTTQANYLLHLWTPAQTAACSPTPSKLKQTRDSAPCRNTSRSPCTPNLLRSEVKRCACPTGRMESAGLGSSASSPTTATFRAQPWPPTATHLRGGKHRCLSRHRPRTMSHMVEDPRNASCKKLKKTSQQASWRRGELDWATLWFPLNEQWSNMLCSGAESAWTCLDGRWFEAL